MGSGVFESVENSSQSKIYELMYKLGYQDAVNKLEFGASLMSNQESVNKEDKSEKAEQLTLF